MEQLLTWQKGLFDSNYQVYENAMLRFSINFNSFKNSAYATTREEIYFLRSEGYSKPETTILNQNHETMAVITYDWLAFKAKVVLASGEELSWSFQNNWLSRWSLNNHQNKQIIYNSSSGSGLVHSNINDDLLTITGLFIREYYSRLLSALVILMVILFSGRGIWM